MDFVFGIMAKNISKLYDETLKEVQNIVNRNKKDLLEEQKSQLWDGKTSLNKDITPKHSQSSYFKSVAQKDAYIKWKETFTSNPKRNKDVPNLFINGKFYSEIDLTTDDKGFTFDANGVMSKEIIPVFKDILGLTDANIEKFTFELVLPFLPELYIKKILQNV